MTPLRDLIATAAAQEAYDRRALELAELEEEVRDISPSLAKELHRNAVIVGHAAWAEAWDPEPR